MLNLKRTSWNVYSGTQLSFGPNAVTTLTGLVERHAVQRIFLITDNVLEDAGAVRQVRKAVDRTDAELLVFHDSQVGPSTDTVELTAQMARDFEPDLLIGLGGGSNMDLAKACRAMLGNECTAESLLGFNNAPQPKIKLVCIPSTAGTGSEVSHIAMLRSSSTGTKATVLSQHIRPDIAIVDPYMTLSCPEKLTATSGFVALTHAIEACLVTNFFQFEEAANGLPFEGNNPFGDMYAEQAMRLISEHLHKAIEEPDHLAARSGMSLASMLAGVAYSNCGGGLCQSLECAIEPKVESETTVWEKATVEGGEQYLHGIVSGIVLPEVVRFMAQHRPATITKIAACLNDDLAQQTDDESAEAVVGFLRQLRTDVGLPGDLSEVGIDRSHLPKLVEATLAQQRLLKLTPGEPTEVDLEKILNACFG